MWGALFGWAEANDLIRFSLRGLNSKKCEEEEKGLQKVVKQASSGQFIGKKTHTGAGSGIGGDLGSVTLFILTKKRFLKVERARGRYLISTSGENQIP